jgi:flagellar biosynthesis/type III secretory pathway protein FliH
MGHAGKAVGRRQGQEEGYQDGLADGFARGRKYGQDESVAAMQAQLDALNQQRNALQELSNGLVMALGAAVDVLKGASSDDKVRSAQSYVHRVDQALQKGMLRVAPSRSQLCKADGAKQRLHSRSAGNHAARP